jgi:hypothetical protein
LNLTHHGQKFEPSAIIVSVLPVLLWLLLTGRITGFKAFGVEFKAAIRQASRQIIRPERIQFEQIEEYLKGSRDNIPTYVERKVSGLTFNLAQKSYYNAEIMRDYLDELRRHSFFRWITFVDADGRFVGLIPADVFQQFAAHDWFDWTNGRTTSGYDLIKRKIEAEDLSDLPGLIGSALALSVGDTKQVALSKFRDTDSNYLPVVDNHRKLVGVVNRGRLNNEVLGSILEAAQGS